MSNSQEAPASLPELARRIAVLDNLRKHHEAVAKSLGSQIAKMESALYDMFADAGLSEVRIAAQSADGSMQFEDGQDRIIKPSIDIRAYSTVEMRPAFFAWMKEHGFGSLIKEEIHHSTLNSWAEKRLDGKQELPPVDLLKITELPSVTVTKAPKRAKKGDVA